MFNPVQKHYQNYPYPDYPLMAKVRRRDTYALNLTAIWTRFNRKLPPPEANKILIAGSGTFAPYPWAVANPDLPITALDLSNNSLRRAKLHCYIHLKFNVNYLCANLLDLNESEKFGLIDSFGVLHHLDDPLAAIKKLVTHLLPGGILRIMMYSRYARREEESIRRAFRLLGIDSPNKARTVLNKAKQGSRLANYLNAADEPSTDSGLADALLHPKVHTYRINDLKEIIDQAGLEILMFAHRGACENIAEEMKRLYSLDKERSSPGNFVLYLGRNGDRECESTSSKSMIMLNPCLVSSVTPLMLGTLQIDSRIGVSNPELTYRDRSFLRRFIKPVTSSHLSIDEKKLVTVYKRLLFLVEFNP